MSAKQCDENAMKNAALGLLARREHSRAELRDKLSRRCEDKSTLEQVLTSLENNQLLSDERFTEAFVRAKRSQGKGPKFIKQELRRRGVSENLIACYVYEGDEAWQQLAEDVYLRKFGRAEIVDNKEKARRVRFMVSRGFTPDTIFRLI